MISPSDKKKELTIPSVIKKVEEKRKQDVDVSKGKTRKLVSKYIWPSIKKSIKRHM